MFKLNIVKMILYFTSAGIYAMIFVLMHFFDTLHDFHFQFIIVGSILLVLFIMTRGRHNFTKTQIITSLIFIAALIAQVIIETLSMEAIFQRHDIWHLIFHIVVAVTYFVFAQVMYFELTKSYKNTVLRQASFDYNDAILFEYDATQHMIQIELSDNIYKNYGLSKKSYKIDYLTFLTWVAVEDQSKIQLSMNLKNNLTITNKIIHLKLENTQRQIAVQIKGAYTIGFKTIFLGFDYTKTETIEKIAAHEQDTKLLLLENLKVGIIEAELYYNDENKLIDYKYIYVNNAILKMMNFNMEQITNQLASTIIPSQYEERIEIFNKVIENKQAVTFETQLEVNQRWYLITSYLSSEDVIVLIYQDIHDLKNANDKLTHLLTHSSINDMLNNEGLENQIKTVTYTNKAICYYISIQGFEQIRAFYGEAFSTELINIVSNSLKRYDKDNHIIANILYKHFVIIMIDPSEEEMNAAVLHNEDSLYRKYHIFDREIAVKLNIGYAETGTYCDNLSDLIAYATIANETSKKSTENKVIVYQTYFKDKMNKENLIANRLYDAIADGHIEVYFQKIYDTNKHAYEYYEALARWHDETIGHVSPDDFFSIAAKSYLSDFLDEYLIKKTFSKFKIIVNESNTDLKLNLNISPNFFFRSDFLDILIKESESNNLKPSQIVIEVSENIFVESVDVCKEIIDQIRLKGFLVAIDDFGSQYSSIGLLERVEFDMLKLDGIFAQNIQSESIQKLVKTIIDIHQKQNIAIVIEKIENQELANIFVDMGCYLHQGYHYHVPEKII